ncbi:MAG: ABC transporter ATP-binding protein [Thermodesulfobacteriota bacterium]
MLEIQDLCVRYDSVEVIKGISLTVEAGRIVSFIGANGTGKSTVLKTISGLKTPSAGRILFEGQRLDRMKPADIVRAGVAQVPEGGRIFPRLTVKENLQAGAYLRRDRDRVREDFDRVYHHFPRLQERSSQKAGTMSGGERQMLAFGRALMAHPKMLIMDEPSLGLSPLFVNEIFSIIRAINHEGVTILLVEQNAKKALEVADKAYVFASGRIVLEGAARELMKTEEVKKAYLGG